MNSFLSLRISLLSTGTGVAMLGVALLFASAGHPPYTFFEAYVLAALFVMLSAMGGFEWGFVGLCLQAAIAWFVRDAFTSALCLLVVACLWYVGVTFLAVRGSRVLMGIAAGVLFAGLLLERIPSFGLQQWLLFLALFLLEISSMYVLGNVLRGRWFSPYA